ncbi:hypothetical protein CKM354_000736300 [Cercospora kikuchii]|uniref:Uncharacterized protein n=1 Tax=Cercospora kikuchii TaxID=84275 RepID=A0A9P3CJ31_9PEZI|nr:uncharacterized protein CKM354_000736300 [Cercospora kikuchii]GIZ44157.1 hypothetical protein CKM354_000736300 [Cercospora kikuchii]
MGEPRTRNTHVRLLACRYLGDPDGESDFRLLVDGKHIKYVTAPPEALPENPEDPEYNPWFDMTTERFVLGEFLPHIPAGNWNRGYVAKRPETAAVQFVRFDAITFESVRNIWHPTRFNEQDLPELHYANRDHETLNGDHRVQLCTSPKINDGKRVIVKRVVWPEPSCMRDMETETKIYRFLRGSGIGPKFLGHLVEGEEGRVIGFVTEYVENTRIAKGTGRSASLPEGFSEIAPAWDKDEISSSRKFPRANGGGCRGQGCGFDRLRARDAELFESGAGRGHGGVAAEPAKGGQVSGSQDARISLYRVLHKR